MKHFLLLLTLACTMSSCYSFKGISIAPETKTFAMPNIQISAAQADAQTALQLTEKFKQKVIQTTRLTYNSDAPDIEFTGSVTEFGVQSLAPQANGTGFNSQQSQLSRFRMVVSLSYRNNKNEADQWSESFDGFADFDPNQSFETVRSSVVQQATELIIEKMYNRAFTNW